MPDYRTMTRQIAVEEHLDPDSFERQIEAESRFDPEAVSPAGATGIAQLMPFHWPNVDPLDPPAALRYAARWMVQLRERYGNLAWALAAYNWGPGNVDKYWDGRRETLPRETQRYLDRILGDGWTADGPLAPELPDLRPEVISIAEQFIGWPYVWGGKSRSTGFDCSGLVGWAYAQVGLPIRAYTDHIYEDTVACEDPGRGDIVLYEYRDGQNCRFPHVGLYIDEHTTLDSRGGVGIGNHPHVVGANRYYRRVRGALEGEDPRMNEALNGFITAVSYLGDEVADRIEATRASLADGLERPRSDMNAEELRHNLEQAWGNIDRVYGEIGEQGAELRRVREQFVGPRQP